MTYKKSKISLGILLTMGLITCIAMHKPASFKGISSKGVEIDCNRGYVTVSEVRDNPDSRKIKVEYVRLKSFSESAKTPIFFLAGGPGQGSTFQSEHPNYLQYWTTFLEDRDVVLIDQRGIGKLNMWYGELNWPREDLFVSHKAALDHVTNLARNAAKKFDKRGIDLNGYNSKENAHDIDTVRDALGYEKIIPFGFSYGTHLGLSYLKYHEDRVEKSILLGVEGLDETFKMPLDLDVQFEKINQMVKLDSNISSVIPDFKVLYESVANKLQTNPIELEIKTPLKLKRKVQVGKFGLDFILKRDMGDASDIPSFPKLLCDLDHGDYELLKWYVEKRYKEFLAVPAMMVSMDLSSGGSTHRIDLVKEQEAVSMFGSVNNFPFLDLHQVWPVNDLGEDFRKPVEASVPVLLLSGDLDINTPSHQAERVSQSLTNSIHLVVKNAGHEQIMFEWETMKTMKEFLQGKDVGSKELAYPPIKFKSIK